MKGRTPNREEKAWMDAIRELGCIVCLDNLGEHTPAAVHHIDGKTKPGAHLQTIPLCYHHHQGTADSRHGAGKKAFERAHGMTEMQWLERTKELLWK